MGLFLEINKTLFKFFTLNQPHPACLCQVTFHPPPRPLYPRSLLVKNSRLDPRLHIKLDLLSSGLPLKDLGDKSISGKVIFRFICIYPSCACAKTPRYGFANGLIRTP